MIISNNSGGDMSIICLLEQTTTTTAWWGLTYQAWEIIALVGHSKQNNKAFVIFISSLFLFPFPPPFSKIQCLVTLHCNHVL
jgi:hypothetical protein